LDVARMADSTVLVLVPESGDDIQAMKSGIMEIADLFVVNKGDRPGAEKLQHEIQVTLGIRQGNAFRGIRAHHAAPLGTDTRADGQTDRRPSDTRSVLSSDGAGTAAGGTVRPSPSGAAGEGAGAAW